MVKSDRVAGTVNGRKQIKVPSRAQLFIRSLHKGDGPSAHFLKTETSLSDDSMGSAKICADKGEIELHCFNRVNRRLTKGQCVGPVETSQRVRGGKCLSVCGSGPRRAMYCVHVGQSAALLWLFHQGSNAMCQFY